MNRVIFLTLSLLLSGCGIAPCIDAQFKRDPVPIEGSFTFEVLLSNEEPKKHIVKCERYYDTICAARGNSWQIREVGLVNSIKTSSISLNQDIKLSLPHCTDLVKNKGISGLKEIDLLKGSQRYFYISSKGNIHTYKKWADTSSTPELISIEFVLKLNGVIQK